MSINHGKLMERLKPDIEKLVASAYSYGSSDGADAGMARAARIARDLGKNDVAVAIEDAANIPF